MYFFLLIRKTAVVQSEGATAVAYTPHLRSWFEFLEANQAFHPHGRRIVAKFIRDGGGGETLTCSLAGYRMLLHRENTHLHCLRHIRYCW